MVERLVASLAAVGRTVIAISHDMRFAAENFGRIIVMRAGRAILDGTPEEVFAEPSWPTLASTYLEPPLAATVGARLGLGPTPTAATLSGALRRSASGAPPARAQ
jgi:energy-coupling factor transport system ATP-binding protein